VKPPNEPAGAWPADWTRVYPSQVVPVVFGKTMFVGIEDVLSHVRRRLAEEDRVLKTAVGFSEAAQGTAKARKTCSNPDKYAACIDPGFSYQLVFIYVRLFALPSVMPDIGAPPTTAPPRMALIRPGASPTHGHRLPRTLVSGDERPPHYLPDSQRFDVIETLILLSHSFLLLHELSHIALGHCDYHQLAYGATEVSEDPEPPLEIKIAELHAMEVQADVFATLLNIGLLFPGEEVGFDLASDRPAFCRFMGFSQSVVFSLFDAYSRTLEGEARYPSAYLRAMASVSFAQLGAKELGSAYDRGMLEALRAWSAAGWGKPNLPTKKDVEHLKWDTTALLDRFKQLRIETPWGHCA
jgi:hypothetical protein